jgi:polar amino acid transport system permease protein
MKYWKQGSVVFLLLLAVTVLGISSSPAAAAAGNVPPRIVYTEPYKGMPAGWGGQTVIVTFKPAVHAGKADPVVPAKSSLWINGKEYPNLVKVMSEASYGASLQFSGFHAVPKGQTRFRVVLVTRSGQKAIQEWEFASTGKQGVSLIDFGIMRQWFGFIVRGTPIALYVAVLSSLFAVILGLLGALGRLSRTMSYRDAWRKYHSWLYMAEHSLRLVPYWVATLYASLFRGTPLLLQIYVVYYAVPAFIDVMRVHWSLWNHVPYPSAIVSGIVALSLNYGGYVTEVFRGGILAVPRGQREAAWALGMKQPLALRRVVLPQAFRVVTPTLGNYFISMIKDTSLISVIAVPEILKRAQLVGGRFGNFMSPLLVAAAIYWALTIFFSFWQAALERRLERDRGSRGRRSPRSTRVRPQLPAIETRGEAES